MSQFERQSMTKLILNELVKSSTGTEDKIRQLMEGILKGIYYNQEDHKSNKIRRK